MGDVTTAKQTTAPSNPDVNPTVSTLLKGLQSQYGKGVGVFNQSLYPGVGQTTQNAWQGTLGAANNPNFSAAVNDGIGFNRNLGNSGGVTASMAGDAGTVRGLGGQFGQMAANANDPSLTESTLGTVARGGAFGLNDPGYARLRQTIIDDTQSNINAQFTNSGRFGGGSHVQSLGRGIGDAVAGLDYGNFQSDMARQERALGAIEGQRQQGFANRFGALGAQQGAAQTAFGMGHQGIGNAFAAQSQLPGLFQAGLMPSAVQGQVGAAQDADAMARRQAENDLFRRQNDAGWETLARSSSILGGTAPYGGQDSTKSVPWWSAALSGATGLAGLFG